MKIICIGRNYVDHAKELSNPVPSKPLIFMKPATAIVAGSEVSIPSFTQDMHHEIEVLLRISQSGKHIALAEASNYYGEIGVGIDFTARDVQQKCKEKGHPWEIAKAFDESALISDFVEKSSYDLSNLDFHLTINEEVRQRGNTRDMIFNFDYLVHYVSHIFTLQQGDIIMTGTPAGVSAVSTRDNLKGYIQDQLFFDIKIV